MAIIFLFPILILFVLLPGAALLLVVIAMTIRPDELESAGAQTVPANRSRGRPRVVPCGLRLRQPALR